MCFSTAPPKEHLKVKLLNRNLTETFEGKWDATVFWKKPEFKYSTVSVYKWTMTTVGYRNESQEGTTVSKHFIPGALFILP